MDNNLITVKIIINKILFKPILININYKYYFIIDKDFIIKLQFPRIKILLKLNIKFIEKNIQEP